MQEVEVKKSVREKQDIGDARTAERKRAGKFVGIEFVILSFPTMLSRRSLHGA